MTPPRESAVALLASSASLAHCAGASSAKSKASKAPPRGLDTPGIPLYVPGEAGDGIPGGRGGRTESRASKAPPLRPEVTLYQFTGEGFVVSRIPLEAAPVAVVSPLESIVGGWWYRAGGYPVGRVIGLSLPTPENVL